MILLYNLSIFFYTLSIRIAALCGNNKARQWVHGRKNIFKHIASALKPNEKRVWFHCASLGEFEQGRPLMEKLKIKNAELKIVLTFFSPSGYEVRKNYAGADYIFYLPADSGYNAKKFIALINPSIVFFVKYEYWYHYFKELNRRNIKLYMVSAIFRKDQLFFKWYGNFYRNVLKLVTHFFLQEKKSGEFLESIGIKNFTIAGDTRFDRVSAIAQSAKEIPVIEKFKNGKKLFIIGSSWEKDEEIFFQTGNRKPETGKLIIAPHEINESRISALTGKLKNISGQNILKFSEATLQNVSLAEIIVIDNIGMLSSVYRYADAAFIGGGFGKGIHNILEAATFGLPIIFGPNYQKFSEARELIRLGGAFSISNADELKSLFQKWNDHPEEMNRCGMIAKKFVEENKGASDRILEAIENNFE